LVAKATCRNGPLAMQRPPSNAVHGVSSHVIFTPGFNLKINYTRINK
jgi:hypothetical protein